MKRSWMYLVALAPAMAFMPRVAEAPPPGAPIIAVLAWDNSSFGAGGKDYDGIGKGIMEVMITELAAGGKFRVVDRERVQKVLDEQNLTKTGAIDPETAVRVGKVFSACYSIYGGFMRDTKNDKQTITAHTTSNETSAYDNPQTVNAKGDDLLTIVADLAAKYNQALKVTGCPGAAATKTGGAPPAGAAPAPTQQSGAKTPTPAPVSATQEYARELTKPEIDKLHNDNKGKIDAKTMLLYSRALDAMDHKDKTKAVELFSQVLAKAPDFTPAKEKRAALTKSSP